MWSHSSENFIILKWMGHIRFLKMSFLLKINSEQCLLAFSDCSGTRVLSLWWPRKCMRGEDFFLWYLLLEQLFSWERGYSMFWACVCTYIQLEFIIKKYGPAGHSGVAGCSAALLHSSWEACGSFWSQPVQADSEPPSSPFPPFPLIPPRKNSTYVFDSFFT